MNLIKRILAAILITISLTIILLGAACAAGILVLVACPFVVLARVMNLWSKRKGNINERNST